jgi:nucleoside 2-deoxyribosyltransferase
MKIYLSHNLCARKWLREAVMPLLHRDGHTITSGWLSHEGYNNAPDSDVQALGDLADVDKADCLLMWAEQYGQRPGRGKYVELGYAHARGKRIVLVGNEPFCVFFKLPDVEVVRDIEAARELLRSGE